MGSAEVGVGGSNDLREQRVSTGFEVWRAEIDTGGVMFIVLTRIVAAFGIGHVGAVPCGDKW